MRILIIAAAALIGEGLVALLAGRLLDHASVPDDFTEKTVLPPRQDSTGTIPTAQNRPKSRDLSSSDGTEVRRCRRVSHVRGALQDGIRRP